MRLPVFDRQTWKLLRVSPAIWQHDAIWHHPNLTVYTGLVDEGSCDTLGEDVLSRDRGAES